MGTGPCFSETELAQLRAVCQRDPRVAALYAFDLQGRGDCNLAALFTWTPDWPERLDLELAAARALGLEGVELINLRRMSLVSRYDVIDRGEPIYVGNPEILAAFIEETIVRYSAYYPLLEALYWRVETYSQDEDRLEHDE
jgi:hypothetical protein